MQTNMMLRPFDEQHGRFAWVIDTHLSKGQQFFTIRCEDGVLFEMTEDEALEKFWEML